MTEAVVKEEGEFRQRIQKQVQWHTIPVPVYTGATVSPTTMVVNLPLVIQFDIRTILEAVEKEAPEEIKKTPWYMKWFKT